MKLKIKDSVESNTKIKIKKIKNNEDLERADMDDLRSQDSFGTNSQYIN